MDELDEGWWRAWGEDGRLGLFVVGGLAGK